MFDHVTIRASDRSASEAFYETVLRMIGIEQTSSDEHYAEWNDFSLSAETKEAPATRRLHIAFLAPSRAHVDAFWHAGVDAGYRDDGAPGPRPQYSEEYYGAFLLDPDGNSAEAVHHDRTNGRIDHLWIRVREVAAAKRFYETIAPYSGFELRHDSAERASFGSATASFSVVSGEPTEHVHLAFAASDNAIVDAFHRTALGAGYRDHGAPGERSVYHSGYYGAYVLDPDGNNVEIVNHNR
jgi:catechol 2,3-dioxygenase-like lactoylglutathione lyase family enzyme